MQRKAGFTLVEMVVVLLLISILLSFAVPLLMDGWHQAQLDFMAQQLHRDIRWAQQEAARSQKQMNFMFIKSASSTIYAVRYTGSSTNLRRRDLKAADKIVNQAIRVYPDKTFLRNGHIMLQKGEHKRYVYFYRTGRTRITKAPTTE